jgi:subtilisin family serine protease
MDPALRELLRIGSEPPEDVIEAVIRLRRPGLEIPGVRIVARFGTVATCRLRLDDVPAVHADPNVISLKASRSILPQQDPCEVDAEAGVRTEEAYDDRLTGRGVVVGAVDWGLDVDHPNFVNDDGTTRLLALWDQRGGAGPGAPEPYGYGVVHDRAEIDAALAGDDPYGDLGYHPWDADRGSGTHATHVMDIAAGNGRAGGRLGASPEAELVFVHLADRGTQGLATLGDSVRLLEAVDYVARTAGSRPWVVNLSVGQTGGPHDGTLLVERAFDELLASAAGGFVVQSGGNYERARTHASGVLHTGESRTLRFVTQPDDVTPDEIEVWYDGQDKYVVTLTPPGETGGAIVPLDHDTPVLADGRAVGWIYHRAADPNNNDHHVDAFIAATAPSGTWQLTVHAVRSSGRPFHAWIERDDSCPACQARFLAQDSDPACTLGTIATSRLPLIVGAYDAHRADRPAAPFSSRGPTRDGRLGPHLAAPGVRVCAARSTPRGLRRSPGLLTVKSGTSMAAPAVTGAVARCLQVGGSRMTARQIRALILGTVRLADPAVAVGHRLGRGYLDLRALTDALLAGCTTHSPLYDKDIGMPADDTVLLGLAPDRIYREVNYRPDSSVAQWTRSRFQIVGASGRPLLDQPQAGDVVLSVGLGRVGSGRCGRVVKPDLVLVHSSDRDDAGWHLGATDLSYPGPALPRRILDHRGKVVRGTLLLRPREAFGPAAGEDVPGAAGPPWTGTAEQLDFRDRVLAAHLERARRSRGNPQPDLPTSELRTIKGTEILTAQPTADAVEQLLASARLDLDNAKNNGEPDAMRTVGLTVTSGYRSYETQLRLWKQYFSAENGYYDRTRTVRAGLPDGPHSEQAVAYMLTPRGQGGFGLGGRIAAPGYSNHQNGIAVDLYQVRTKEHAIHNDSDDASRSRWRASWFHHWLCDNAERFGFRPLSTEEWHWEHRAAARHQRPSGSPRRENRPATDSEVPSGSSETETPVEYLGGRLWTFTASRPRLRIAVFLPRTALGRDDLDVLVFAHGLLSGCPRPAQVPSGFITDPPFELGRVVGNSGRPVVLLVPEMHWGSPGGADVFGPRHARWHALGEPTLLNGVVAEALAEVGRIQGRTAVTLDRLLIAGHSRAYDLLEPLAARRRDPEMGSRALAKLSQVIALDTTYGGDVDAWTDWLRLNPRLTVDVFYRAGPDSPTSAIGDEFFRHRSERLRVTKADELHCSVPPRRLAAVLVGQPSSADAGVGRQRGSETGRQWQLGQSRESEETTAPASSPVDRAKEAIRIASTGWRTDVDAIMKTLRSLAPHEMAELGDDSAISDLLIDELSSAELAAAGAELARGRVGSMVHAEVAKIIQQPGRYRVGTLAAALAHEVLLEHHDAIDRTGTGTIQGNQCGAPVPTGATASDCTSYALDVVRRAFALKGRTAVFEKVMRQARTKSGSALKGTEVLNALQQIDRWEGLFWSPDPRNPEDGTSEHPAAFKKVRDQGTYYGLAVDRSRSVIEYRRTDPRSHVDMTGVERLRRLQFAVLAARGGWHLALLVSGSVYEVHWKKPATDRDAIQATPIEAFVWQSGAIAAPAGDLARAWKGP